MPIGGQNNYPSLAVIANLVRSIVDDDKPGATGTAGEGQILTNTSVTLQNFMNSAIRDTYRDVRIMGQPTLIRDNYILSGLTPVNSSLGVGAMNPAVQVSITFNGYFDGVGINSSLTLPSDLLMPIELWEREGNTEDPFGIMQQSSGALSPRNQTQSLGEWEWRGDGIWMHGATQSRDVRIRYYATFIDLVSPSIDWNNTFVPIMDSQEAIADKIAVRYAARLGGEALADARLTAQQSLKKLQQQTTRDRQFIDFRRPVYGDDKAAQAGNPASWLY